MTTAIEDKLCRILAGRRAALVDDLAAHVAIPTGKNHAAGLDDYRGRIVERLRALGATDRSIPGDPRPPWLEPEPPGGFAPPPTVVCTRPSGGAEPEVMLAGHLDTVFDPAGAFRSMSIAPDGATAVGPGVVDMKGGILVAVAALEALAEVGADVAWTFLLNSDEESGSFCSDAALRATAARRRWGIALEPALPDGSLAIERKGSGQFQIEVHGRSAHAGRAFFEGCSAVYGLARVLTQLEMLSDADAGVTVNVGPLAGGIAPNVVPDHAAAWGNVRFPTAETGVALGAAIDTMASPSGALPRVDVHRAFSRPAKPALPETLALAERARAVAVDLGQTLPFAATGGVCDGNIMQDAGLPTIDTLGVRGGGLHTTDEWIELASLVERAQLLACLLARLTGASG